MRPSLSSHDWHVQPSCQRPNRLPPERRAFSPDRLTTRVNPAVLETFRTHRVLRKPVNPLKPQDFHLISTAGEPLPESRGQEMSAPHGSSFERSVPRSSAQWATLFSAHAEAEEFKLEKRSLGGYCDERLNPSRSLVPESRPRGRSQFQRFFSVVLP